MTKGEAHVCRKSLKGKKKKERENKILDFHQKQMSSLQLKHLYFSLVKHLLVCAVVD